MVRDIQTLLLAVALFFSAAERPFAQDIPVVVHIVSTDPDKITDRMVEEGIKDLNDAFSHQGSYAGLGPGYNTGIRFCLAKRDPNGGNTKGITRTKSVLGDFDRDIEDHRMKGLVSWDSERYCNIWLTDSLKTEIFPTYACGKWERSTEQGYATFPATRDFLDGVVVTSFGRVLAHNMGHYLGLLHSFTPNSCENGNCNISGDGICDTPPSSWNVAGCNTVNSCTSDTVNAQGPDLPDLVSNFMTYSDCANSFTKGQADRMKGILNSNRSSLLWSGRCDPACPAENLLAEFTRDNWFPVPNEVVKFSNTNSRGSNFEWYIDGTKVSDGKSMSHAFPDTGKYGVTLKVYNGNPACFGSQTDSIIVTCGVMSRYYPDKRVIASKDPILLEEVIFTNRSVPLSSSFEWWLGNGGTFPYQKVSTEKDLRYSFLDSGTYTIRLVASLGGCSDTTYPYKLRVEDPTLSIGFGMSPECLDQTKLKMRLQVCNGGYSTMPAGTPITFYDDDPTQVAANKLGQFLIPEKLTGKCCIQFDHILDVGRPFLDKLYGVINDKGNVPPPFKMLEQPPMIPNQNNLLPELLYADNVSKAIGFAFRVSVTPPTAELVPDSLIRLQGRVSQPYKKASWLPSPNLSCQDCLTPNYNAGIDDEKLRFLASSANGCHDTTEVEIKVKPWNDFRVAIDSVDCHSQGNIQVAFTLCNDFVRGSIPAGLVVTFYAEDPTKPGSPTPLGTKFTTTSASNSKCTSFTHVLPSGTSGNIYAVVNDIGTVPYTFPTLKTFQERDYGNNVAQFGYNINASIAVAPFDTTVLRGQQVQVRITSPVVKPSSILWTPDPSLLVSCSTACTDPVVTVLGDGLLRLRMENRLSCKMDTVVRFKILPPDYQIRIDSAQCHSPTETIVDFTVCTGNGYDSIPSGLPVSFFDGAAGAGSQTVLAPSFVTTSPKASTCATYTQVVATPASGRLFAVVNQRSTAVIPTPGLPETDLTNNSSTFSLVPFMVTILPSDTTVPRLSRVALASFHSGGQPTSYSWKSSASLTCGDCPNPVADVPYTSTVSLEVKNRFNCFSQDTILIKTFAEGRYQIPNAFTPNGDGLNDVFYLIGNRDLAVVRDFSVYDRYGQRVFQRTNGRPNDPAYGWNGTRNGTPVTLGTYAYTFQVELVDGKIESLKGLVTIIR